MTPKESFEEQLRKEPCNMDVRAIFADWLDDHGLYEEAAEQRRMATPKWCMSHKWLTKFAARCGTNTVNYNEHCDSLSDNWRRRRAGLPELPEVEAIEEEITLETVLAAVKTWVETCPDEDEPSWEYGGFKHYDGDYWVQLGSEQARDMMGKENVKLLWHHYQILTGTQVPEYKHGTVFSCTC